MKRFIAAAVLSAALAVPAPAHADVVRDWNKFAASLPTPNPFVQARTLAMAQLAVFDAVNAITNEYEPYHFTTDAPAGASADAAAIAAAHHVLKALVTGSAAAIDNERITSLAAIPDGPEKAAGIAIGEAAGAAMLALRQNDGAVPDAMNPGTLVPPTDTAIGEYQLTTGVTATGQCTAGVLYHWRNLTPFALPKTADFLASPPPALGSSQYAKDYNEVQKVGGAVSTVRSLDREDVVRFYAASSPGYLASSIARQLAEAQGRSMSHTARALALVMMSTNDSLVASFASKYKYNLWRPETAIRNGRDDPNGKTAGDAGFSTFINTPCFPSYPSNHASGSNGAGEMLRRIYGAGDHEITLTHPALPSITLQYESLQAISNDVDDARVYGGIHFRFDQDGGVTLGRRVATYVYRNWLRPLHHD
jgi:hypothetical protein